MRSEHESMAGTGGSQCRNVLFQALLEDKPAGRWHVLLRGLIEMEPVGNKSIIIKA